ncbi:juvenile hormone acid methyl transferase-like [Frankliniella occidentalis]|uniref:Juvenile hormone acid O-methyltransferase n=1 Tax=Frankliniella occidentalis TaxID=133901 RepID=A0A6J1RV60_FRAOC|nr:juvenile hormone acid O-methyltransferase [Frankliniella occidentalis]XP_026272733.1 juvenile hormone acid O-methyltransferase [Frankliniella occidentalis]KAE8748067.1 juvenile hormone acid methyl transferase-like [Frankliniella occidentalis]
MHNADQYEGASELQRRDAREALDELVPKMQWVPGERVCDQGSGDGWVTNRLLATRLPKDYARIVGMDKSGEMVRYALQNHQSDKRITFVEGDVACGNPLWHGAFTKVLSFNCWHWVKDQSAAARTTYEMLAPGGELGLVCLARSPIYELFQGMARCSKWACFMEDVDQFISPYQHLDRPEEELTKHLEAAGLEVVFCQNREKTYTFKSEDALRESIAAVNPFLNKMPEMMRNEFMDDCMRMVKKLDLIQNHNNNKDDGVSHIYSQLVVHARKRWH